HEQGSLRNQSYDLRVQASDICVPTNRFRWGSAAKCDDCEHLLCTFRSQTSVGKPFISECQQEQRSLFSLAIGNVAATKAHVDNIKSEAMVASEPPPSSYTRSGQPNQAFAQPGDKECRNERVIKSYGHQSQYDYYEHDTYHVGYNIEMKDYMMYQGDYGDQYYHSSNESPSFINQPQRPTQEYYYQAFETHVDRLLEQLNKDETYEPQCITMLDFDKEDEGEDENKEFTLHSTNTMEYLTFDSYKDVEDKDNDNNSFEDLISPVEEHDKESVPFKVGEGVMEANTTPYLPTLKEPILSLVDDIRSKEDEEFWLFRYIRINVQIYWMKLKSLISKIHLNFQG
nr:hypothetical protein [Tanacetum cinerariifolium]